MTYLTLEERWSSDTAESINSLTPCVTCKHSLTSLTCAAFPKGIPQIILLGDNLHLSAVAGDKGIRYERKE